MMLLAVPIWVILLAVLSSASSVAHGETATDSLTTKQRDLSNKFGGGGQDRPPPSPEEIIRDVHQQKEQDGKLPLGRSRKLMQSATQLEKKMNDYDFTMAKQRRCDIVRRKASQTVEKAVLKPQKTTEQSRLTRDDILRTRDEEMSKLGQKFARKSTEDFIRAVMACKDVPGLAVAVVSKGIRWTKGFGFKDLVSKRPVDSNTLFGIGSITKGFTSALLAVALQEANKRGRKVSWNSTVASMLGEDFKLTKNLQDEVTLGDVLSHRTGLMAADIMAVAGFPPFSRSQFISRLHYLPAELGFRKFFHYNNWLYSLAGDVTEHLLQDSWRNLLRDYLLSPLGMDEARMVWDEVNVTSPVMAQPFHKIRGSLVRLDELLYDLRQGRSSGALAVSADDMTKWMEFLLAEGVSPKTRRPVVYKELMTEQMTPHIPLGVRYDDVPVGDTLNGYGYGWLTGTYRGKKTIAHTGGWFGYTASLTLYPEDNSAVFVATSGPGTDEASDAYRAITYHLADIALGYSPWLKQRTACSPQLFGTNAQEKGTKEENEEEAKKEGKGDNEEGMKKEKNGGEEGSSDTTQPEASLMKDWQRYIGRFSNPLFGEVVIFNSTLSYQGLQVRLNRMEGVLIPSTKASMFHVRWTGKTEFYSMNNFDVKLSMLVFSSATGQPSWLILTAPPPQDAEELLFDREA